MLSYPKGDMGIGPIYKPTARLWLTADRSELVPDGDPKAAFLFCVPGRGIPMEEAKKYGLLKESKPAETKEIRQRQTKAR